MTERNDVKEAFEIISLAPHNGRLINSMYSALCGVHKANGNDASFGGFQTAHVRIKTVLV